MFLLAGIAIAFGWVRQAEGGGVNLQPWLTVATIGGIPATVVVGAVSRRIARGFRGPVVLAALLLFGGYGSEAGIARAHYLLAKNEALA